MVHPARVSQLLTTLSAAKPIHKTGQEDETGRGGVGVNGVEIERVFICSQVGFFFLQDNAEKQPISCCFQRR